MKSFFVIIASFLVALLLQILPLPNWAVWYRPEWVVLALVYWALMQPERIGVIVAFMLGIVMDLLTGTLLGQHALAYVLIVYFTLRFYPLLRQFPLWQQAVIVFLFLALFETFQLWIWGVNSNVTFTWMYWLPCVISAFIWPWVFGLMRCYQRFYRVY